MQFYTLKVIQKVWETDDTVTLSFKQPGLKKIRYRPGQYITLILRINNRRYLRPYSFSCAPGVDQTLDITVKRMPRGIVSNHIIDKLQVDEMVEVMEPMGDFILQDDASLAGKHLFLWAAGSGITPLMSIIKYVLSRQLVEKVILVYGNRNLENVIFNAQLNELENQYHDIFSVLHFHTQYIADQRRRYLTEGRIDPQEVFRLMELEKHPQNSLHYICGPTGLKESVKNALAAIKISASNIYTEDFEIVRDPADFENVITRTVSIVKNNQTNAVEVVKGRSILEAGLDASIELSYSCQTGNCKVCMGRLLSGEVKMIGAEKNIYRLAADECLLCCSFPLTNNVAVSVE